MPNFTCVIYVLCTLMCSGTSVAFAQSPSLDLRSKILTPPISIEKDAQLFHEIRLRGEIDGKGEGRGVLTLDPNPPEFDLFGTGLILDSSKPQLKLDVNIQFVRAGRTQIEAGPPPEQWFLYRITSDKLQASIGFAAPNQKLLSGRLLIYGKSKEISSVVELSNPFPPGSRPLPCHPGCFPAGTLVSTPNGTERIEELKPGSVVITLDDQGRIKTRTLKNVFVVNNDVLRVETEEGLLVTTETQPLRLGDGSTDVAGSLSKNETIMRWKNGKMIETRVLSVQKHFRATRVHNLVFDETTFFVADGFVVRSKPPAIDEPTTIAR